MNLALNWSVEWIGDTSHNGWVYWHERWNPGVKQTANNPFLGVLSFEYRIVWACHKRWHAQSCCPSNAADSTQLPNYHILAISFKIHDMSRLTFGWEMVWFQSCWPWYSLLVLGLGNHQPQIWPWGQRTSEHHAQRTQGHHRESLIWHIQVRRPWHW